MQARSLHGSDALVRLGEPLDDLLDAAGAPITARRPWLQTWAESYPHREPWVLVVERDGRLEGAALLARRRAAGRTRVMAMGQGPSDYVRLPCRSVEAEEALARTVARALGALRGPWSLRVERIPAKDPVARRLADLLPVARIEEAEAAPRVVFHADREASSYMTSGARQTERSGWNRIRRDGAVPRVGVLRDADSIEGAMDQIEGIRYRRDRERRGRSALEDPSFRTFWRSILSRLARRGELEVITLHLDDRLVAYTLGLRDARSYRTWDGRFDPGSSRYSPGRLADFTALRRALVDPSFAELDYMRGVHGYKLSLASEVVAAETLVAWSSRVAASAYGAPARARSMARGAAARFPAVARVRGTVRPARRER